MSRLLPGQKGCQGQGDPSEESRRDCRDHRREGLGTPGSGNSQGPHSPSGKWQINTSKDENILGWSDIYQRDSHWCEKGISGVPDKIFLELMYEFQQLEAGRTHTVRKHDSELHRARYPIIFSPSSFLPLKYRMPGKENNEPWPVLAREELSPCCQKAVFQLICMWLPNVMSLGMEGLWVPLPA